MLIAKGPWDVKTMANIEELDPAPFLQLNAHLGLSTWVRENHEEKLLF